eukprot:549439-Hanusia_phi.AAC.1
MKTDEVRQLMLSKRLSHVAKLWNESKHEYDEEWYQANIPLFLAEKEIKKREKEADKQRRELDRIAEREAKKKESEAEKKQRRLLKAEAKKKFIEEAKKKSADQSIKAEEKFEHEIDTEIRSSGAVLKEDFSSTCKIHFLDGKNPFKNFTGKIWIMK